MRIVTASFPLVIMTVIALPINVLPAASSDQIYGAMMIGVLAQRTHDQGLQLRQAIKDRYAELKSKGELSFMMSGNDISSLVAKYIKVGMKFDDAERILTSAAFQVSERPAQRIAGNRPDKYAVLAISYDLVGAEPFGFKNSVTIQLMPQAPGDYSRVSAVYAFINMASL